MYDSYGEDYGDCDESSWKGDDDCHSDIDFDSIVDEIIESREGRLRWTMVDSDLRIWDAMVVGNKVLATTEELARSNRQIIVALPKDETGYDS